MKPPFKISLLHKLAHLYGVQVAYYNVAHQRQQTSAESLLAVLKALGAPIETPNDVVSALRQKHQEQWQRIIEPVFARSTQRWDSLDALTIPEFARCCFAVFDHSPPTWVVFLIGNGIGQFDLSVVA